MSRAAADALLLALGERLGMPALALDAGGACQLVFDGRWLVTLLHHAAGGRLLLHCPVSAPDPSAEALRLLMEANFMGRASGRGSFALGPDRRACFQIELPLALADAAQLQQGLEQLLDLAAVWAPRLERAAGVGTSPARAAGVPAPRPWLGQRV